MQSGKLQRNAGLPHGAKGIEFGDFAITFQPDKVVLLARSSGDHYTLHTGHESGILDFHRTSTDSNGLPRHETLFAIHHADLMKLLEEFGPTTNRMVRLFRRLRPGWLIRQNIGIVKGLEQVTDEHIMAVTKVSKRKRLVIDEAKLLSSIHVPIYLDEVWDGPDGWFSLFAGSRRIGLGVRVTDSSGHPRMRWVRLRDLSRFSSAMQRELMEAARRYAIPTEKYGYYNIGRRS